MYEIDIDRSLSRHVLTGALYGGCFSADNYPLFQLNQTPIAYVVNTEPSHLNGKHWVVVYYVGNRIVFFDSLGQPPLGNILLRLPADKLLQWNPRHLQGSRPFCGQYCLYFILTLVSSQHSMAVFSDFCESNDAIVYSECIKSFGIDHTFMN